MMVTDFSFVSGLTSATVVSDLTKISPVSVKGQLPEEQREASIQGPPRWRKVVRDAYVRLMRYHTAATDEQAAVSGVAFKPDDYIVFELRDMRTGPIAEIHDRLIAELITAPTGELLVVTPHHLQYGIGPMHSYYDVEWTTGPSTAVSEKRTFGELIETTGNLFADIEGYTSYEVTIRLGGKERTYRAIALHHRVEGSSGKLRTEILDNITGKINAVLADESPRVRSPWKTYVKSALYLADAADISKKERAGKPLIPADASIGYLPGDDIAPADKHAMQLEAGCVGPITTDDVVVIGWINSSVINLPDGANAALRVGLNTPVSCSQLLFDWYSGVPTLLLNKADKAYANAFLLKNSGNGEPPATIDPATALSSGDFRLFNRFQVQFSTSNGLITDPRYIQFVSNVGKTPDPCGVLPAVSPETHQSNGAKGITLSGQTIYQLTEGRVGNAGQAINSTINGRTTPWIWAVIKFNTFGEITTSDNAIYFPTYTVYKNGGRIQIYPQSDPGIFIKKDATYQRLPAEIQ